MPTVIWQCEQYVRMNASTTGWPLYWLNDSVFPLVRLMVKSGAGRGKTAAGAEKSSTETSAAAAGIACEVRISLSVSQDRDPPRW